MNEHTVACKVDEVIAERKQAGKRVPERAVVERFVKLREERLVKEFEAAKEMLAEEAYDLANLAVEKAEKEIWAEAKRQTPEERAKLAWPAAMKQESSKCKANT